MECEGHEIQAHKIQALLTHPDSSFLEIVQAGCATWIAAAEWLNLQAIRKNTFEQLALLA